MDQQCRRSDTVTANATVPYELGVEELANQRMAVAFDELALAI